VHAAAASELMFASFCDAVRFHFQACFISLLTPDGDNAISSLLAVACCQVDASLAWGKGHVLIYGSQSKRTLTEQLLFQFFSVHGCMLACSSLLPLHLPFRH
jgi:hypothetical protein